MSETPATRATVLLAALLSAGGCGFVHASDVSHNKPSGFVLRGQVRVPLPAADPGPAGTSCTAPPNVPNVAAGAPVSVTDPGGHEIARGVLGTGLVARTAAPTPAASASASGSTGAGCDFPFEIRGVPGGVSSYGISVAGRAAQAFPALALRQGQVAVITITP